MDKTMLVDGVAAKFVAYICSKLDWWWLLRWLESIWLNLFLASLIDSIICM